MNALGRLASALLSPLALVSCSEVTHEYDYDSPDRAVTLVVRADEGREPERGLRNRVYLVASGGGSEKNRTAEVGRFTGLWKPAAFAWIDDTTVSACPLRGERDVEITIPVTTPTSHRTYRIITEGCPAFLLQPPRRTSG
jgi:hypothetical protein